MQQLPCRSHLGVLGALAIIIAVLIVINARNDNLDQNQTPSTVTETTLAPPGSPAPAQPTDWTEEQPRMRESPHIISVPPGPSETAT